VAVTSWPRRARAQQPSLPVIGYLGTSSVDKYAIRLRAFREGLKETGYAEGQNVAIEYRWANYDNEKLPNLAAELVRRQVTVIVAGGGTPAALAAKAATSTIPVVFAVAVDPVKVGLVASLKQPGGNMTGVVNQNVAVAPKRLELLHELLPAADAIALLVNPTNPAMVEQIESVMEPVARALGMRLHIVRASTERDFDAAFAAIAQMRADALVIDPDVLFNGRPEQLAARAFRQALPAIFHYREFVAAGGLIAFGASETEYYRLVGIQTGRILNGEKPAGLPVEQTTKIELLINLKTAKSFGLTIPQSILARADEVID
jgi:putative ABC transport system substrate-binding protein